MTDQSTGVASVEETDRRSISPRTPPTEHVSADVAPELFDAALSN